MPIRFDVNKIVTTSDLLGERGIDMGNMTLTIRCSRGHTSRLKWLSKPPIDNFPNATIQSTPSEQSESHQYREVSYKQAESKGWTQECGFINKSPIDRPLVQECAPQVESSFEITAGILREKRESKQSLDRSNSDQVTESGCETSSSEGDYEEPWKIQKNRHLDGKCSTANARS